jgi:hypothetical protein
MPKSAVTGHLDSAGNRSGRTLHRHYLHKKANGGAEDDLKTIDMLRPLEGVPVYDSKQLAGELAQKNRFHP